MSISIASRKHKARRLQNWTADKLREWATALQPEDIKTASMGVVGSDIQFSPAAQEVFPFDSVECKNSERVQIYKWYHQAETQGERPILVHTRNREDVLVTMKFMDFLGML